MNGLMTQLLPYLGFGLSLAGLVARLFPDSRPGKSTAITSIAICLVIVTGFGLYQAYYHVRQVNEVAEEIVISLGQDTKTFDKLYQDLFKADLNITSEALDKLVQEKRVGYREIEARDRFGTQFTFRGYYVPASYIRPIQ